MSDGIIAGFENGVAAFLTQVFLFLPNLIAALLILFVGYLAVRFVTGILDRGMKQANFERRLSHTRLGQAVEKSGSTLTSIVVSAVKWLLLIVVVVYAISALNIAPLTLTMMGVLAWIPTLVGVGLIVGVGLFVGSWIGKGLENLLPKYGIGGGKVIGIIVEILIYLFVFNLALLQIGIGQGVVLIITTAMAWGVAAAVAIGLGGSLMFALREFLPGLVSGATTIASTLKPGQKVTISGVQPSGGSSMEGPSNGGGSVGMMTGSRQSRMGNDGNTGGVLRGTITSVGMFNTVLQRDEGGYVVVPNKLLVDKPVVVESGDEPKPFEHQLRTRAASFQTRFEQNMQEQSKQRTPSIGQSRPSTMTTGSMNTKPEMDTEQ